MWHSGIMRCLGPCQMGHGGFSLGSAPRVLVYCTCMVLRVSGCTKGRRLILRATLQASTFEVCSTMESTCYICITVCSIFWQGVLTARGMLQEAV